MLGRVSTNTASSTRWNADREYEDVLPQPARQNAHKSIDRNATLMVYRELNRVWPTSCCLSFSFFVVGFARSVVAARYVGVKVIFHEGISCKCTGLEYAKDSFLNDRVFHSKYETLAFSTRAYPMKYIYFFSLWSNLHRVSYYLDTFPRRTTKEFDVCKEKRSFLFKKKHNMYIMQLRKKCDREHFESPISSFSTPMTKNHCHNCVPVSV